MNEPNFDDLQSFHRDHDARATIEHLISILREQKRYHPLFDALLMKRRLEMGLALSRPTALKDVPEANRDEFERYYMDQARDVGGLLLADGQIAPAWNYFRAIGEPERIAKAINDLPEGASVGEDVVEIALFQGVAPIKGLRLFLASHGTCSTITALDQQFLQMSADVRAGCARVLVRKLFDDVRDNVQHDVLRRAPLTPTGQSLRDLIAGREALFADDSYHIDVSHLNSVVRFGRALETQDVELDLALQLAQYGSRLAPQYQYAGNPPFDEFYPAHIHYFQVLLGQDREQGLSYFRKKLGDDLADTDNQLTAYVLVDLLQRLDRRDEALEIACKYLAQSGEEFGLSLPDLCTQAGRFDLLARLARDRGDLVGFAAALLSKGQ
ncbi:MAG: hypothetical protein EXS05_06680 [Planctomycetaceae bacterium]|nr:hypothetical protein [Planctomycetaceae bacterium]